MKKPIFTGSGVAIVTPFTGDDLKINFSLFEEILEYQIQNGTDAIIVCGTTGEKSTLVYDEHVEALRIAVETVGKRVPVIAGTGSNDTKHAVMLSNDAERFGVDGLLMVTPYYNKASQDGLIESYSYIEKRVSTPIILYNVPSRTGVNIKPETYLELSKLPLVNSAKEANGDISALAQSMALCGDNLNFYSGNDDQITAFMSLGAKGVISVLANVAPKLTHDIAQYGLEGDLKKSAELQLEYIDLCNALFCDVNPIPVKAAMSMMGFDVGRCRMPLSPLNEKNTEYLKSVLKRHNMI
ncbi:MAG: 4-hydroxy-tetrahydrodipicolinate synthase [Ruminococcaceae bacterium]|nr:4-hydroxy-tetrahydrodipicolinate synthase [Oscillospiraceae bacterium]